MDNPYQITPNSTGREIWEWWCRQVIANGNSPDIRDSKGRSSDGPCAKCQFHQDNTSKAEFGLNRCPISGITRIISKMAAQDIALQNNPIVISKTFLKEILLTCNFNEEHVSHIAAYQGKPGIVGSFSVLNPERDNVLDVQVFLIDGTHRAVNALRTGTPYSAYVLNFRETFSSTAFFGHLLNPGYGFMHDKLPDLPDPKDVAQWVRM